MYEPKRRDLKTLHPCPETVPYRDHKAAPKILSGSMGPMDPGGHHLLGEDTAEGRQGRLRPERQYLRAEVARAGTTQSPGQAERNQHGPDVQDSE